MWWRAVGFACPRAFRSRRSCPGSALGALFSLLFEQLARGPDGKPRFPVQLDLELFASATLLATGVGLLSALIPARRAAQLDPAQAIRNG